MKDVKWVREPYTVFVSLVWELHLVSKGKDVIFGGKG